jgi:hypothetical protein
MLRCSPPAINSPYSSLFMHYEARVKAGACQCVLLIDSFASPPKGTQAGLGAAVREGQELGRAVQPVHEPDSRRPQRIGARARAHERVTQRWCGRRMSGGPSTAPWFKRPKPSTRPRDPRPAASQQLSAQHHGLEVPSRAPAARGPQPVGACTHARSAVGVLFSRSAWFPVRSSVCSETLNSTHRRTYRTPGTLRKKKPNRGPRMRGPRRGSGLALLQGPSGSLLARMRGGARRRDDAHARPVRGLGNLGRGLLPRGCHTRCSTVSTAPAAPLFFGSPARPFAASLTRGHPLPRC